MIEFETNPNAESKRRPGGVLAADDFEKGKIVTVKEYPGQPGPVPPGVPLKVLAVELPFIAVTPLGGNYPAFPLDIRDADLIACSEEYKRAFTSQQGKAGSPELPWTNPE